MWMLLIIMMLTSCSDHSGDSSDEKGDCFLNIYVYGPERPMLTRADVGDIASKSVKEHMVHTLRIWVFKHNSDGSKAVGYLKTEPTFLNETNGQEMFQMKVDKEFADHPENVDVYVVGNAENVELKNGTESLTLGENTTRDQLDAAKIGESSFGVVEKEEESGYYIPSVSTVPSTGLPMSAVEKDQPIYGSFPTLRIGSQERMTTLQLIRAVSKLRFVLCRITNEVDNTLVSIDNIQLNNGINSNNEDDESTCRIPKESYLMPVENPSYTTTGYVLSAINYGGVAGSVIPAVEDPLVYAYETQSAQEYENLINTAIDGGQLTEIGPTYLRESDKQLTGTIHYTIENLSTHQQTSKVASFSMAAPGDFRRNRSWIIYAFYLDATIYTLTVTNIGMKSWASGGYEEKSVYNW